MAVIPSSHMQLVRARHKLSRALESQDWTVIGQLDKHLGEALTKAAEDPSRDALCLMSELKDIIGLYRDLIEGCQQKVSKLGIV